MILFSKIMCSCPEQKLMKNTLDKKCRTACYFRAPMRLFKSFTFLKNFDFIS